jgi:hypothetical protein
MACSTTALLYFYKCFNTVTSAKSLSQIYVFLYGKETRIWKLLLNFKITKDEPRLRVFENRILRRALGPK